MGEHLFFDCNASFGRYLRKPREARWSMDHLLGDLDLAGIGGALVYHRLADSFDSMLANVKLIEEIEGHRDRLFPCWIALPSISGEFPSVDAFVALMDAADVRAVRIEPEHYGVPVKEGIWGELRDALLARGTLCVLPVSAYGASLMQMEAILEIFRENNTVLVDAVWSRWKHVVALMDAFPNLYMEFSAFQANRGMEYFAERFGAERCLFGTGLPEKAPGAARGFLDFTLLEESQARLIAGENLRRLLGGCGPSVVPEPGQWHDSITEAARSGRPVPCAALDAHCHMLHDGGTVLGNERVALKGDADGMIELARRAGMDRTAIMSWAGPLSMDTDLGNETIAKAVSRYPDEFMGLATVNPDYDDEDKIQEIIQEYHVDLGFPGLKTFTPCQAIEYDDPAFDAWFQFANDHKLYLVLDTRGDAVGTRCVRNLAERYPHMGLHLDHCGRGWDYAKWVVSMIREYPNTWGQLNFTLVTNGVIEYMVGEVGAERILFGTDAPMRDPRPQVAWLVYTRLKEAEKRRIFGENFAGILRGAGMDV